LDLIKWLIEKIQDNAKPSNITSNQARPMNPSTPNRQATSLPIGMPNNGGYRQATPGSRPY